MAAIRRVLNAIVSGLLTLFVWKEAPQVKDVRTTTKEGNGRNRETPRVTRRVKSTAPTEREVRDAARHVIKEHRTALDWLADR